MKRVSRALLAACAWTVFVLGTGGWVVAAGPLRVGWSQPKAGHILKFPADHGAHPDFRTEWWYVTGHLTSRGRPLGFQVTFFRRGLATSPTSSPASPWAIDELHMAHFALSDPVRGLRFDERVSRPGSGASRTGDLAVRNSGWVLERVTEASEELMLGLEAHASLGSLRLSLMTTRPPVVHGQSGFHEKSPGAGLASHYVSLTRMEAVGILEEGDRRIPVSGLAWFDHEWMSSDLPRDKTGWDWLGVHLSDGSDLMVARVRSRFPDQHAISGTWVNPDGRWEHLPFGSIRYEPGGEWVSPSTGGRYPVRPLVAIPSKGFSMEIIPVTDDQELNTKGSTGVIYWEGMVNVKAQRSGQPVTGTGYLELTGYAGPAPLSAPER